MNRRYSASTVKGARLPDFALQPKRNLVDQKMVGFGLKLAKIPTTVFKPLVGDTTSDLLNAVSTAVEDKGIEFPDHPVLFRCVSLTGSDTEAIRTLFHTGVVGVIQEQLRAPLSIEKSCGLSDCLPNGRSGNA